MPRFRVNWTRCETYTGRAFIVASSQEEAEILAKKLINDEEEPLFTVDHYYTKVDEKTVVVPDETTKPDPSDIVLDPQS